MPSIRTFLRRAGRRLGVVPMVLVLAVGGLASAHAAPGMAGRAMHTHADEHRGSTGGERGMGRMLDEIGATDEQRAQIGQILQTARENGRAQHEAGLALRQQMSQLMAQPTIDTGAVEALRQQMVARHDAASQRRVQTMLEVAQVLTPDQRAQVAERMQARAERMQARRDARERRAP